MGAPPPPGSLRDGRRRTIVRLRSPVGEQLLLLAAQRRGRLGILPVDRGLRGHAVTLADEAEQDVLGADVVVIEHPGFFLRQDNNPPLPVGEPLEHALRSPFHRLPGYARCQYDKSRL